MTRAFMPGLVLRLGSPRRSALSTIHRSTGRLEGCDLTTRQDECGCASKTLRRLTWALLILPVLAGMARADELPLDPVNPKGHVGDVLALGFTPDGKTLITAGSDGLAKIWDVATRTVRADLTGHEGKVLRVAVSSDGKTIATGGEDRTVRLWSTTDGARLGTLSGHSGAVTALAFAPDGKTLASGSPDTTIRLWDVAARRAIAHARGARGGRARSGLLPPMVRPSPRRAATGRSGSGTSSSSARRRSSASRKNRFGAWPLPPMVRPSSRVAWTRWCGSGRSASPNRSRLRDLNNSRVSKLRNRNNPSPVAVGRERRARDRVRARRQDPGRGRVRRAGDSADSRFGRHRGHSSSGNHRGPSQGPPGYGPGPGVRARRENARHERRRSLDPALGPRVQDDASRLAGAAPPGTGARPDHDAPRPGRGAGVRARRQDRGDRDRDSHPDVLGRRDVTRSFGGSATPPERSAPWPSAPTAPPWPSAVTARSSISGTWPRAASGPC